MLSIYYKHVNKGKKIVLTIIIITNIYYLINFVVNIMTGDRQNLLKQILVLLTIAFISFLFYKGFNFAEWLTIMLLVQPVLTAIFGTLKLLGILELYNGWFMLVLTILLGVFGGILLGGTKSISAFMKEQKKSRKWFKIT